jgi:LptD protein
LKSKNSTGPSKWYQELQLSYTAKLDNQIATKDSDMFTHAMWKNLKNGFSQNIPLSLQIRPFTNFSISPSINYSGVMYTQKFTHRWDPNHFDAASNKIIPSVVIDTTRGIFYGQAVNPSISASFNPQIFGMYLFSNPNSRLQAIRHVIKPSIGFSFVPVFAGLSSKMYRQSQIDSTGKLGSPYSIYQGGIYGTPSLSSKSGSISLSLVNIVEGKVFARNDTTGKPKKIKIIDNFGINTSYNIFADSLRWAPVTMQIRTSIFNKINISANSSFSLYGLDSKGNSIGAFLYDQNGKLMRLTNFQTSLDFSLSELLKGNKGTGKTASTPNSTTGAGVNDRNAGLNGQSGPEDPNQPKPVGGKRDQYGYLVFDVPWALNISYSFNYSKPGYISRVSQTLSCNGNVTVTKKMSVTYTTGYDFKGKVITMTQIGVTRDLHCWTMLFNWVPNGTMQSWNFTIRVKASVLGDLKYDRRKDYHDSY